MQKIPSEVHGVLDYLTVGTLLALPRIMNLKGTIENLLTGAAIGTLAYSLATRYELGLFKILPFKTHLALDAMSGAAFAASPLLFKDEEDATKMMLAAIGAFELVTTVMSNPEPFQDDWANQTIAQVQSTVQQQAERIIESTRRSN